MANRDVNINVSARDQASAVFGKIGASARQMFGSFSDAGNGLGGLKIAAQFFAGASALAGGVNVTRVAVAALNGEWEKMPDLLAKLPFGIGAVSQQLHGLLGELTGINAEIEESGRLQAQGEARSRSIVGSIRTKQAGEARARGLIADSRLDVLAASGDAFDIARASRARAIGRVNVERDRLFDAGVDPKLIGQTVAGMMQAVEAEFSSAFGAEARRRVPQVLQSGFGIGALLPSFGIAAAGGRGSIPTASTIAALGGLSPAAAGIGTRGDLVARDASLFRFSPGGNTPVDELRQESKTHTKLLERISESLDRIQDNTSEPVVATVPSSVIPY